MILTSSQAATEKKDLNARITKIERDAAAASEQQQLALAQAQGELSHAKDRIAALEHERTELVFSSCCPEGVSQASYSPSIAACNRSAKHSATR
jgi:Flp pilus assembly protein CpaB